LTAICSITNKRRSTEKERAKRLPAEGNRKKATGYRLKGDERREYGRREAEGEGQETKSKS